jgi:hypothetical protein
MNYSFEEAEKLCIYYTKELVGKYFDEEKAFKVSEIEINKTKANENRYELQAITFQINGYSLTVFEEISKAAKRFGLLSPDVILSKK